MSTEFACIPITPDGQVGGGWGKASTVAVAEVVDGAIVDWRTHEVGWDLLHDAGEGSHHARIVRFLGDNTITVVVEVTEQRAASSGNRGVVTTRNTVYNQGGDIVMVYSPVRLTKGADAGV